MARSKQGDATMGRVLRARPRDRLVANQPFQGSFGVVPNDPGKDDRYAFLDQKHVVWETWHDRWVQNEARLAGGDEVVEELRPFDWETDPEGFYKKRQNDVVYTNFSDIYMSSITGSLLKVAPKPDAGWSGGNLGKVTGRSTNPTQAEQVWYSVDNPSGAGAEWNQFWMDAVKRAGATGHRWMYVESTSEAPLNRQREKQGFRPYLVEFSPVDAYNWYINERDVLEFVVFRLNNLGPVRENNGLFTPPESRRGYLLLVREGCVRLGEEFMAGGWWLFDGDRRKIDDAEWTDTDGEIPVSILYYQRSKGTSKTPAISRPGITELGQAAIALMNLTSSANYNAWEAGGGVDYLCGIDEDAFNEVTRLSSLGSRRLPLPPNSETDAIPSVAPSSLGAVEAQIFESREQAVWNAAVRTGIIEAGSQIAGSAAAGSGATAEATFSAVQGPRIIWVAQNVAVCQNNILRYFELRYGHKNPNGLVAWPSKFDLVAVIDRIRSFFEVERLSGIRSKTAGATAMVIVAEEKGVLVDPDSREKVFNEYLSSAQQVEDQAQANLRSTLAKAQTNPSNVVGKRQKDSTQNKQSARLAAQKALKDKGPKQKPVGRNAPGVRR